MEKKFQRHFSADFTDFVGDAARKQTHFLQKNMFYPPVSVHHRGWVGFALRCTQSTMGLKVAYLQVWLVKGYFNVYYYFTFNTSVYNP